jgi:hypothetical protein
MKIKKRINVWHSFVKRNCRHLFPSLPCHTRFNRSRRALLQVTELLRQKLIHSFPVPISRYFVIDSFPLPVCKFGRARYCRSFRTDRANYGRCPSKKETYFGFKVHALITLEGYIMAFEITPASEDNREGLWDFAEHCLGLVILDDSGLCTRLQNKILGHNLCMAFNSITKALICSILSAIALIRKDSGNKKGVIKTQNNPFMTYTGLRKKV